MSVQINQQDARTNRALITAPIPKNEEGDPEDCPICLTDVEDPVKVLNDPCASVYCRQCLLTWLRTRDSCPGCRTQVPEQAGGGLPLLDPGLAPRFAVPAADPPVSTDGVPTQAWREFHASYLSAEEANDEDILPADSDMVAVDSTEFNETVRYAGEMAWFGASRRPTREQKLQWIAIVNSTRRLLSEHNGQEMTAAALTQTLEAGIARQLPVSYITIPNTLANNHPVARYSDCFIKAITVGAREFYLWKQTEMYASLRIQEMDEVL